MVDIARILIATVVLWRGMSLSTKLSIGYQLSAGKEIVLIQLWHC